MSCENPNLFPQSYRDAMANLASGIHVVTSNGEAGCCGITMTAVTSVSDNPPTVILCINQKAAIQSVLRINKKLCINILSANQQDVAEHFAGLTRLPMHERFLQHSWREGPSGQLQIDGALVHLHGHIIDYREMGTHTVFYAAIDYICGLNTTESTLLYFRRNFHSLVSHAPTVEF